MLLHLRKEGCQRRPESPALGRNLVCQAKEMKLGAVQSVLRGNSKMKHQQLQWTRREPHLWKLQKETQQATTWKQYPGSWRSAWKCRPCSIPPEPVRCSHLCSPQGDPYQRETSTNQNQQSPMTNLMKYLLSSKTFQRTRLLKLDPCKFIKKIIQSHLFCQ